MHIKKLLNSPQTSSYYLTCFPSSKNFPSSSTISDNQFSNRSGDFSVETDKYFYSRYIVDVGVILHPIYPTHIQYVNKTFDVRTFPFYT